MFAFKRILFFSFLVFSFNQTTIAQQTPYELDPAHNTTTTYEELIRYYQTLADSSPKAKLLELGKTDVGKPLHLLVLSQDELFDPERVKAAGKAVLFINNGIHPGEPEGIDVGMMFARDMLQKNMLPKDVVICMIPVYNVAGMLNRGVSRVNQNGPTSYGFRGSLQHYDLNRDFIKADTRNSLLFQKAFTNWDPDMFFDTHASNGADYQYIMTLIATQKDKLAAPLSQMMQQTFLPELYQRMAKSGYDMVPYVNTIAATPESGLVDFLETPRYSSGFAALHHTIGFMPETHMWKPYEQRVESTYMLLQHLLDLVVSEKDALKNARSQIKETVKSQSHFPITWALDTAKIDSFSFKGFQHGYKPSKISGKDRLYYDRSVPKTIQIPHYKEYYATRTIEKPMVYVLPQAYDRIVERLLANGVRLKPLEQDTVMEVQMYYIQSLKTSPNVYEGHYMHTDIQLKPVAMKRQFYAGDWWIEMDQTVNRYIVETLEPEAHDSFFRWNFFDGILSQKEYFSAYIFEEEAEKLLNEHPEWKQKLEAKKAADSAFASNGQAQLDWIYKQSVYYEDSHFLYPVGRVISSPRQ
ncbi:M14 family zinc carboxypeptidase [Sphingobacterium corticis]|uniref:M14 family zinc carboxypeptidase n=1 Tax=Sphingobacterium corticis TaxID=1812823 RepID=A0ABW5NHP0_9SPHI